MYLLEVLSALPAVWCVFYSLAAQGDLGFSYAHWLIMNEYDVGVQ